MKVGSLHRVKSLPFPCHPPSLPPSLPPSCSRMQLLRKSSIERLDRKQTEASATEDRGDQEKVQQANEESLSLKRSISK